MFVVSLVLGTCELFSCASSTDSFFRQTYVRHCYDWRETKEIFHKRKSPIDGPRLILDNIDFYGNWLLEHNRARDLCRVFVARCQVDT
jgi:hypothetical protein